MGRGIASVSGVMARMSLIPLKAEECKLRTPDRFRLEAVVGPVAANDPQRHMTRSDLAMRGHVRL